jgi:hypothetical protein
MVFALFVLVWGKYARFAPRRQLPFVGLIRFYKRFGRFRVDSVTIAAQSSHSVGSPMSQRQNAGFNWTRFSIGASDKLNSLPKINVVGSACFLFGFQRNAEWSLSLAIGAFGVGQPASVAMA